MSNVYFGQDEADIIFKELIDLDMELDEDPLSFGPKRINNKISFVRGMLSRCEREFLDVSQQLHTMKRSLKIDTLKLELAKNNLFANDPETRAGKSVSDREAIAAGKLHQEMMNVHDLEMAVDSLTAVWMAVKTKRADLKDIENRLKDQFRLCLEEVGLGAHWGTRNIGDISLNPGLADQAKISDLTDLLNGVDVEINLGKVEGSWEDPEDPEDPEELETVDTFDVDEEDSGDVVKDAIDSITPDLDVETLLPPQSAQEDLDAFLNQELVEPKKKKTKVKPEILEDDGIEDILSTFESE